MRPENTNHSQESGAYEGIEAECFPVLSITSECVGRGFDKYRIAADSLPDLPIAPRSGHNGVTSMLFGVGPPARGGCDLPDLPALHRCDGALENMAKLDSSETP